ncbi:MAG: sensor histidine kinase [Bacteroidetes bacterium]|nr:sensor histidine kinase [Bacteroidota bacterium]
MEYDNDRKINPTTKIEIFCWILLGLLNPLVNAFTIFWIDPRIWIVLLLISIILLPAYLIYSRVIVPKLLFRNRPIVFILASIGFFAFMHLLLMALYAFIMGFDPLLIEQAYFSYKPKVFVRESIWIFINMFLAVVAAFVKKTFDEEEIVESLQKDNTLYRLKYLQSQLNPHFLFNTLNSIYSLSLQKSDQAPEVVVKLADLMRYLVYECNEPKVLLKKEIEFIQNYIEIEKIRHKADIKFTVEGDTDGIMIEPFLFISFIENGFKHALNDSYTNPFVYINLKVQDKIELTVINNTNLDLETQSKRIFGTGITNSKHLLDLLYPDTYALNIIQTDKQKRRESVVRFKNAKQRLEMLYPDSHTLDVLMSNNAFTVSLIVKPH